MAHAPAARGAENQRDEAVVYESGKQGSSSPSVTGGNCAAHRRFCGAGWRVTAGYQFRDLPLSSDAHQQFVTPNTPRATHGSPPARGGLGGGRAALDDPTNSIPQTPRCARCFRRYREPFPETRPPPPDPPLAGGNCAAHNGIFGAERVIGFRRHQLCEAAPTSRR